MKITRFLAAFGLVLVLAILAAVPPAQAVQQAGLEGGGDALEVNRDNQGYLYVSDGALNKIWHIRTSDGYYQTYSFSHKVRDAQPGNNNRIWWVTDDNKFGYVNPGSPIEYYWELDIDPYLILHSLAPDGQGGIWMGESGLYDENSRLFHFNPGDRSFCQYDLPGGAPTHDLLYQSGYIWLADSRSGRLFRISLGGGGIAYTFWQANPDGLAWGIDFDGRYLWWADLNMHAIGRLDTEPGQDLATYYYLPDDYSPITVRLDKGQAWYTTQGNRVGTLFPALAQGDSMNLYREADFVSENCTTLGFANGSSLNPSPSGFLGWEDSPVSQVHIYSGWKIFELPDAFTFGMSAANNYIWVSDISRDLLLRFDAVVQAATNIYIPLIRR